MQKTSNLCNYCYRIYNAFTRSVLIINIFHITVLILQLNLHLLFANGQTAINDLECHKPLIEILVSPMISSEKIRELELLWIVDNTEPNDWVALYDKDPVKYKETKPIFQSKITNNINWIQTNIQEKRDYSSLPFYSVCMGYWSVYWRNYSSYNNTNKNIIITASCLRTFPTWMKDRRSSLKKLTLKDMFIPGTHDAAAYLISYYPFKETIYQKYVYTQDEMILDQLIMGVRYLDIRIGLYNNTYWVNHGSVTLHPLSHILNQVKHYMDHTEEIVIIDFHRFPVGFKTDSDHISFAKYLINELKDYMAENIISWSATLEDIWSTQKRLIVSYNHYLIFNQFRRLFWPQISHKWADAQSPNKLYSYLSQFMMERTPRNYLWAAMAELTPNTWSLVKYRKGLREMANAVNKNITILFHGNWGYVCNIVAVDYFRSTGIIHAAVKWNECHANE